MRDFFREALDDAMRQMAGDIKREAKASGNGYHHRDQARRRAGQPTVFAPRYAELNPGGSTDIVHVITTLEGPTR